MLRKNDSTAFVAQRGDRPWDLGAYHSHTSGGLQNRTSLSTLVQPCRTPMSAHQKLITLPLRTRENTERVGTGGSAQTATPHATPRSNIGAIAAASRTLRRVNSRRSRPCPMWGVYGGATSKQPQSQHPSRTRFVIQLSPASNNEPNSPCFGRHSAIGVIVRTSNRLRSWSCMSGHSCIRRRCILFGLATFYANRPDD